MRVASLLVALALIIGASVNLQNVAFAVEGESVPLVSSLPENTEPACTNGLDDDQDLLTDLSDPECSAFAAPAPLVVSDEENTVAKCSDGLDNDADLLTDMSDSDCSGLGTPAVTDTEDSYVKCNNGLDDDMDLLTDYSDSDCAAHTTAPVVTSPENTELACTNGLDDDMDLLTDFSDGDCSPFVAVTTPTSTPTSTTPDTGGSNPGGGSIAPGSVTGGGGTTGFTTSGGTSGGNGLPSGQAVLGASTGPNGSVGGVCNAVLLEYMRMGKNNSPTEVKKLQVILNSRLGTKLPINGVFGPATDAAVRQWQQLYSADILTPWVNAGLMATPVTTGYVYKTTTRSINNFMCGGQVFPMPMLP